MSKKAGFAAGVVPLISTSTLFVPPPPPGSEVVARLYLYLQSTVLKLPLVSFG